MSIVFVSGSDPVRNGLVTSLNRRGGNVTGVAFRVGTLAAKRLGLLHQLVPKVTTIGALVDPKSPTAKAERSDLPAAAQAMGLRLPVFDVGSGREIEAAAAAAVQGGAGALLVGGGAFLNSQRERLVALAARHKLPASFIVRETVWAGGLMSYGPSQTDAYRQAGDDPVIPCASAMVTRDTKGYVGSPRSVASARVGYRSRKRRTDDGQMTWQM